MSTLVCTLVPPAFCNLSNPYPQRPGEEHESPGRHDRRRRQAPEHHRDAQGQKERSVRRLGRFLRGGFGPFDGPAVGVVAMHDGYSVTKQADAALDRPGTWYQEEKVARIAPR